MLCVGCKTNGRWGTGELCKGCRRQRTMGQAVLSANTCAVCMQAVGSKCEMNKEGFRFHEACASCTTCGTKVRGENSFLAHTGQLFCENHVKEWWATMSRPSARERILPPTHESRSPERRRKDVSKAQKAALRELEEEEARELVKEEVVREIAALREIEVAEEIVARKAEEFAKAERESQEASEAQTTRAPSLASDFPCFADVAESDTQSEARTTEHEQPRRNSLAERDDRIAAYISAARAAAAPSPLQRPLVQNINPRSAVKATECNRCESFFIGDEPRQSSEADIDKRIAAHISAARADTKLDKVSSRTLLRTARLRR